MSEITFYQAADGSIEVRLEQETVWLSQVQMVMLFGRDQSVISRHIGNLFKEGELERESNMQKMHIANSDKPVDFYNLDVIISVGYRVKSQQGTRFRQWATRLLREHLTLGYTLNRRRFEAKAAHLLYFVIKNHPFSDGNKRSGAFLFVDFLNRNGRLLDAADQPVINDIGLAALTLLVAASDPTHKETMIRLIMNMLATGASQ